MLMRNRCVAVLLATVLFVSVRIGRAVAADVDPAEPAADDGRIVVMISLDGLAGYYLDDPKADLPTLRELAREGARAASMKASTPTVTWPNHTTLVTGDNPARHGVVGNNYYDREAHRRVTLISDPTYDKDQIVKVPTIYDLARKAGLRTAAIRWPATRNAKSLQWTIPDVALADLLDQYSTPSLVAECKQAGIWSEGVKDEPTAKGDRRVVPDETCVKIFNLILHDHRPNLALLHLINVDHTEHLYGPRSPEAYAAVHEADGFVRQVRDELQRDFPGKATLLIVSDHGFSAIQHSILPNVILREAGLVKLNKADKVTRKSPVHVIVQGGAALLYINEGEDRPAVVERIKAAFHGVKGIDKVVTPDQLKDYGVADPATDPHAPDMIVFADEGYSFGDTAAGALPFNEKPERKGTHGHDASIPDLHATFIAWGDGIRSGVRLGEVPNIDVAPTIAKLLHIAMPDTDGKPLAEILAE